VFCQALFTSNSLVILVENRIILVCVTTQCAQYLTQVANILNTHRRNIMLLQGKARIKEQGSFAERKAARVAKGPIKYEFHVYLSSYMYPTELVATFRSRKEAEKFAFEQRGPLVGNSAAVRMIQERHPYQRSHCDSDDFHIERVEATQ
jgi:hypothetical protein